MVFRNGKSMFQLLPEHSSAQRRFAYLFNQNVLGGDDQAMPSMNKSSTIKIV